MKMVVRHEVAAAAANTPSVRDIDTKEALFSIVVIQL